MHTQNTTTGPDFNLLNTFADILELAALEPGSIDEANEMLYAIGDAAKPGMPGNCRHFIVELVGDRWICSECGLVVND